VSLPWSNLHTINFNAVDAHLKSVVPEAMYDRTRKLGSATQVMMCCSDG
jgi:hypothetical protein